MYKNELEQIILDKNKKGCYILDLTKPVLELVAYFRRIALESLPEDAEKKLPDYFDVKCHISKTKLYSYKAVICYLRDRILTHALNKKESDTDCFEYWCARTFSEARKELTDDIEILTDITEQIMEACEKVYLSMTDIISSYLPDEMQHYHEFTIGENIGNTAIVIDYGDYRINRYEELVRNGTIKE